MTVPGCGYRDAVLLDHLHIFHLGYGMDAAASAVSLLAYLGHYGHARKFDTRLAVAYDLFDDWCHREGRTSSIDAFSRANFRMGKKGFLGGLITKEGGRFGNRADMLQIISRPSYPRFPTGTSGKAFDTSLLLAFLQDDMRRASEAI